MLPKPRREMQVLFSHSLQNYASREVDPRLAQARIDRDAIAKRAKAKGRKVEKQKRFVQANLRPGGTQAKSSDGRLLRLRFNGKRECLCSDASLLGNRAGASSHWECLSACLLAGAGLVTATGQLTRNKGASALIAYDMAISHSLNFNLNSCVLLIAFIFVIVEQIREMAKTTCALYCTWRITISAGLAKAFT